MSQARSLILALSALLLLFASVAPAGRGMASPSIDETPPPALSEEIMPGALAAGLPTPDQPAAACQWGYYAGGKGPFIPLYSDPDGTSPTMLYTGNFYRSQPGPLSQQGVMDFDGDNRGDLFRLQLRPDGLFQWQFSSGGAKAWEDLAYANTAIYYLKSGDFSSANDITDIFAIAYDEAYEGWNWLISADGRGSYSSPYQTKEEQETYKLGDFTGDGRADVFYTLITEMNNIATYNWRYKDLAVAGSSKVLAYSVIDPSEYRLGDFDGDGKTDIFTALAQNDGSYQWIYSNNGLGSFQNLALAPHSVAELVIGDFNGDHTSDVFTVAPRQDGKADWAYYPGGLPPAVGLMTGPSVLPFVTDINGDGTADAVVSVCSSSRRFTRLPGSRPQALEYKDYFKPFPADVNGDGLPDIIWSSICQQSQSCPSVDNIAAVSLSQGGGRFTHLPRQALHTGRNWSGFTRLVGDWNGDGRDDLLFVYPADASLTGLPSSLYVAVSDGKGGFNLTPRMTFGAGFDKYSAAAGDFNGDGRVDLVLSTICLQKHPEFKDYCPSDPSGAGKLRIGLNTGGNLSFGLEQDLGGAGWRFVTGYLGDLDADGRTDILFNDANSNPNVNSLWAALSTGSGLLDVQPRRDFAGFGPALVDARTGDFNRDGRMDLFWYQSCPEEAHCTLSDMDLAVGLAQPGGNFTVGTIASPGPRDWIYWTVLTGDVDGDGDDDIVWANWNPSFYQVNMHAVQVMRSDGGGGFTLLPLEQFSTGLLTYRWEYELAPFYTLDLTGDGKVDLAATDGRSIEVLLNGPPLTRIYLPLAKKR